MTSELLRHHEHRPWALPRTPWLMTQAWESLLFAHWPVARHHIQPFIPPGLSLDLYDNQTWISVVPFQMHYKIRYMPGLIRFNELNVRTYVVVDGKPGVLFLSLDANHPWTVWGARKVYALPYFHADISVEKNATTQEIAYLCRRSDRLSRSESEAVFEGVYSPKSPIFNAEPGSLEHWLTERYCLYTTNPKGVIFRANVHHLPWSLQHASATILQNTMAEADGVPFPETEPILHYSDRLDVLIWPLEKCYG